MSEINNENNDVKSNPEFPGSSNDNIERPPDLPENISEEQPEIQSDHPLKLDIKSDIKSDNEKKENKETVPKMHNLVDDWQYEEKVESLFEPRDLSTRYSVIQVIMGHKAGILAMIYIKQTQHIATGGADNLVKIWAKQDISDDANYYCALTITTHKGHVYYLKEIIPLGVLCSCGGDAKVHIYSIQNYYEPILTLDYNKNGFLSPALFNIYTIEYLESNKIYLTAGEDKMIRFWSGEGQQLNIYQAHERAVMALLYISEYNYLATGGADKTVKIWDGTKFYICIKSFKSLEGEVDCLRYYSHRLLVSCEDGVIHFINMNTLKRIRCVQFTYFPIHDFFLMEEERFLVCGSNDGKVRIWEVGTNNRTGILAHSKEINSLAFINDYTFASAAGDFQLKIWKKVSTLYA